MKSILVYLEKNAQRVLCLYQTYLWKNFNLPKRDQLHAHNGPQNSVLNGTGGVQELVSISYILFVSYIDMVVRNVRWNLELNDITFVLTKKRKEKQKRPCFWNKIFSLPQPVFAEKSSISLGTHNNGECLSATIACHTIWNALSS